MTTAECRDLGIRVVHLKYIDDLKKSNRTTERWHSYLPFYGKKNRGRGAVKCHVFELKYVSDSDRQLLHTLGVRPVLLTNY